MVYTLPPSGKPGSAGAVSPVLSLAEDRVLRMVMTRDVVHSDDLVDDLFPFVHPDDTFQALDRLSYLGLIEIKAVSRMIGFHGYRPRRVMITQKGHSHVLSNRAQDGRLFPALVSLLPAGLLIWLADCLLGIVHMGGIGFWMMMIASAGLAVLKTARFVMRRN